MKYTRFFPDQHTVRPGDWVRWQKPGMPKPIRSQAYVNSRGNWCVGGHLFRYSHWNSELQAFVLFELVRLRGAR